MEKYENHMNLHLQAIWFFVGIHGFLAFLLISIVCLIIMLYRNLEYSLAALSILFLGLINLYYALYYSGYFVHIPILLGIYPLIGLLGHFFLYHFFLFHQNIRDFKSRFTIFHMIIPVLEGIRNIPYFSLSSQEKISIYLNQYQTIGPEAMNGQMSLYVFGLVSLGYISRTFYLIQKSLKVGDSRKLSVKLFTIQLFLIVIFIFWICSTNVLIHISLPVSFSILVPIFIFLSLYYPYFHQIGTKVKVLETFSIPKYVKSTLRRVDLEELELRISNLVEEKFYLDEEMSLPTFAKKCNISTHQLSEYFNMIRGHSYSEFLKALRVQESIELMQSRKDWNMTRIGLESGFQSVSSFYEAFKKEMGESPKEYKRRLF
jgi:AraC-like DNA-binding protein